MKLLNRDPTPMGITGIDVMKEAMRIRIRRGHTAPIARDLGNIGTATLDEWAHGHGVLPPSTIDLIARYLFGDNVILDRETNLLKRTPRPSTAIGAAQPPFKPARPTPTTASGWPPIRSDTPQAPAKRARAGWAED